MAVSSDQNIKSNIEITGKILSEISKLAEHGFGKGTVADYISSLGKVNPNQYGLAVVYRNGDIVEAGNSGTRFSIQSVSKLFTLTLAMRLVGPELWTRVHRNPSMDRFNSVSDLENNNGIPGNPFVNAGAIVVSDAIASRSAAPNRIVLDFMRTLSGQNDLYVDQQVALDEAETGHRNFALAYLLKDYGNISNKVDDVLSLYFRHCAIEMSCTELAQAALYLANDGVDPKSGQRIVSAEETRELNALLVTSGMYNSSGEFAFRVGLPAKSGVSGGILAIVPQRMAICVWSPELDTNGNSVVGQLILEYLTQKLGISVF
ncbi:MAG: glutaminase [Rhodospirillales bacterium]|jgi:glutaminase|nr:glutaminase [Rhodospirillales bacterium]MBT4038877.1 glutaminase [Rhodospirillales bacterium]MBT4626179.1 glutaminase [Rhodospirillales bacterium]MBT5350564.1 glutaminase [Rhodospirillales bacterium]MBT5522169.1 glutaminase [Rhodospirillales bacterium]